MSSYLDSKFTSKIDKNNIKIIFELGSRDLLDAISLYDFYKPDIIYSFECNPDCLIDCKNNKKNYDNIILIEKAVSINNEIINFYPFDLNKYDNKGASSLLKIDFSNRDLNDPDYNRENPQLEIKVEGIRLDTFMDNNNIDRIDLLCIDLQGYELLALQSLSDKIKNVKYIIVEVSFKQTYIDGCSFEQIHNFLKYNNFTLETDLRNIIHFEMNCLYINNNF
jgi:FkbM family methyltransferase